MPKKSPARPGKFRRILKWVLIGGVTLALAGLIALTIAVYTARASLPSFEELKSSPNGQMIRVHAVDGTVIASLGPSYGEWIDYSKIPAPMRDAMVSIEDRRFRSHWGVDPVALARITKFAFDHRGTDRRLQGASTITQQVARTIFLSNKYDVGRKLREMVLALALERKFTKDQILELYLNKVYFGGGAYGIDAASRTFFGHPATNLTLSESAVIAGLVKAPSRYSPTADAEAAIGRASVVLDVMVETGALTRAQADAARPAEVKLAAAPKQNSVRYFTDWALPQLEVLIDETEAPLDVWTTIDLRMQNAATQAIQANTPAGAQGALVSLDRDGAVRAMVGGRDYVSSIYNRATQATRQPGSAFKLFVYLAALEAGHKPDDQVVDEPVTIGGWSPRNNSGRFSGEMSLRSAFAYSINTVAAKLGQEVGFGTVADMARRFGITTPVNTQPAMVLGTSNVRLIDMTRAFASVANKGVGVTPYAITRVTANGAVIYQHEVDTSRVLVAPYVAAQMTDLMQTAVATGSGKAAQIGRPVAGKTGTTTSNKDGWFLGFSSGLTTGVWMGRDDAKRVGGLQGGAAPARAFAAFMRPAVANRPAEEFETEVTLPEWQIEPDDESYGAPDNAIFVDEDGNPIPREEANPDAAQDPPHEDDGTIDQDWLDRMTGRGQRDAPPPRREPADRAPPRDSGRDGARPLQESRPNE
ncbi:PBP1A family penicillin-binding protein [Sphingomonas koreensis]|uniref:transglycosylase domain-containing protein n=1 Tax=Sphingomonas koreensis TaxID=93064 RepID=UPI0008348E00|nr:PBP1A family penicillin-binding protein [Sphingomonas koreensis]PJI88880.1 penicillin-binding protein 1A [Sphingomonas koreensis]RSU63520.1 PBP1A family penicillin-binding protein [Sphingomonas koreensis]RSU64426.1 PBP1A family penicillin-binding protein [Sphingomonas koreensis]